MKAANLSIIVLICVIFTGCATRPPIDIRDRNVSWDSRRDKLSSLTTWQASGRISVRLEKHAWSATLQWHQQQQEYFLRLIAPLGQGTYEITGNNNAVFLRTAKNEVLRANNPESLMEGTFGWSVPLTGLIYWIRGLPEPGTKTDALSLDEQGRITDLSQSGWRVTYSSYNNTGGLELPDKISLENDKLKVRLVIKHWKI